MSQERRSFYRHMFKVPIQSFVSIININGNSVIQKYAVIEVTDLSVGGLKFYTDLKFPPTGPIMYQFDIPILKKKLSINGKIVRRYKTRNQFEYGVQFIPDQEVEYELIQIINQLTIKIRKQAKLVTG